MNFDRRVTVLWALALALITYREVRHPDPSAPIAGMPRPWVYGGASIAFGFAALVGEVNGPLGVALAAAWTIAIFLGYFGAPSRTAAPITAAA